MSYEDGVIEHTLKISDGDLRRSLNLLQSAAKLVGTSVSNGRSNDKRKKIALPDSSDEEMEDVVSSSSRISISNIDDIAGRFPSSLTTNLIKVLRSGNTRNYNKIATEVTNIVAAGYAAHEVLSALYAAIIAEDEGDLAMDKPGDQGAELRKKARLTSIFSEYDKRLIDGVDEQLALLDMSCQIAGVLAA